MVSILPQLTNEFELPFPSQLNGNKSVDITSFIPAALQLLGRRDEIKFSAFTGEVGNGLNETCKYYKHNQSCLDDPKRNFGLVIAKKDNMLIGTIWLHFHEDYATFIGIRSTIPYLLARSVDKSLKPVSSLLISEIIQMAKQMGLKKLYCDALQNMQHILRKYHGFRNEMINHDIKNLTGWGCDFNSRLSPEDIEVEKAYSKRIGEEWDDSITYATGEFQTLSL